MLYGCTGFLSVVEIGQYFMTQDTGEQFYAKACREYTLPRNDASSQPKGWIQGDTKIGPVLEVTTSCLYGKHGVEIRIWSLSEDNSQSWVRISHGSNKFVIDSNSNTESPEDLPEEQASQLKVKDFAARSKAKAKPQRREPVDYSPSIIPMNGRKWIDIEPGNSSLSLSYSTTTRRRCSSILVNFHKFLIGLTIVGKHVWRQEDEQKGRYQYCNDDSRTIVYFQALQGNSGRNLIDPLFHDNVVIQSGFFQHVYHIGCAFNLHSITNNG